MADQKGEMAIPAWGCLAFMVCMASGAHWGAHSSLDLAGNSPAAVSLGNDLLAARVSRIAASCEFKFLKGLRTNVPVKEEESAG